MTAYEIMVFGLPKAEIMGIVGCFVLGLIVPRVLLPLQYRTGDANGRSVCLCGPKDVIGKVGMLIAAGAVWLVGSAWPDLVVAVIMATLFLWPAASIT